jgi:hypothetical protein
VVVKKEKKRRRVHIFGLEAPRMIILVQPFKSTKLAVQRTGVALMHELTEDSRQTFGPIIYLEQHFGNFDECVEEREEEEVVYLCYPSVVNVT